MGGRITVRVEQRHIDEGVPNEPGMCPVALAIKGQPGCRRVLVGHCGGHVYFENFRPPASFHLPKKVSKFILDFDEGEDVEPFEFKMNLESDHEN